MIKTRTIVQMSETSNKVKSSVASTNPQWGSYKHNAVTSHKEHWNIPFGRLWRRKEKFPFTTA